MRTATSTRLRWRISRWSWLRLTTNQSLLFCLSVILWWIWSDNSSSSMASQSDSESEEAHLALDDWDNWYGTADLDINSSESDHYDDVMDDISLSLTFFVCEQIILLLSQCVFFCIHVNSVHLIMTTIITVTKFLIKNLVILKRICGSWPARRPLDLSFFVMACHNDRQTLNNYIEPCPLCKTCFSQHRASSAALGWPGDGTAISWRNAVNMACFVSTKCVYLSRCSMRSCVRKICSSPSCFNLPSSRAFQRYTEQINESEWYTQPCMQSTQQQYLHIGIKPSTCYIIFTKQWSHE